QIIFMFLGNWNSFMWPNLLTSSEEMYTLPVGLNSLYGEYDAFWNHVLAGAMFMPVPVIIVFLIFQRHFIKGLATTGLKCRRRRKEGFPREEPQGKEIKREIPNSDTSNNCQHPVGSPGEGSRRENAFSGRRGSPPLLAIRRKAVVGHGRSSAPGLRNRRGGGPFCRNPDSGAFRRPVSGLGEGRFRRCGDGSG